MKKLLVFLTALAVCACGAPESEDIRISFTVSEPLGSSVMLVYHTFMTEVPLDENGCGDLVIEGIDAAYVAVYYGQQSRQIYVEKGDCAEISFNGRDFLRSFSLTGEKKSAADYLNTISLPAFPDDTYALPFDEFVSRLNRLESQAVKLLEAAGLEGTGDFEYMEKGRIRYSYAAPILMYPLGHSMLAGGGKYVPSEDYFSLVRSYFVADEKLVDIKQYKDFIIEAAHVLDPSAADVKGMYGRTVAQMRFIADSFTDVKVREALLHYMAAPYVAQFGIEGIDELQNIYRTYVKNPLLLADYQKSYDRWDVVRTGSVSPDFSAEDLSGKKWSLADFKGKYVYIDVWATWCGPCRRELPYLKQLKEDFKDAEIVFVGLSVDQDKSKWSEMAGDMPGVQLYLGQDSRFAESYGINSIPRFILLDRDSRVVSAEMSRPSSPDTQRILQSLDGIMK